MPVPRKAPIRLATPPPAVGRPVAADSRVPAPFLKWAGGKRSLLPRLLPLIPRSMETYYEPFLGGGAVFFALSAAGPGGAPPFRAAVLADRNEELIRCYRAVRDDVDGVLAALGRHRYDSDHYYRVRDMNVATLDDAARAARTIFLNRTGYNGLYRVNSSGQFNVPFGRYRSPRLADPPRLLLASAALARAELRVDDFSTVVAKARPNDFVYFDPPYVPVSATAKFTAYSEGRFGPPEQERLARLLRELGQGGVRALLSNSHCAATRALYRGLPTKKVEVRRAINSVASRRGPVTEILVRSFAYPLGGANRTGGVGRG